MFTYIALVFGLLLLVFLYQLNAHLTVKDATMSRYRRWKTLNSLVATSETSKARIVWISLKMILQTIYIAFLQYMNSTVHKLDRKTYVLTYVIDGKTYKMVVVPTRGPPPVLQISNENLDDITDRVLPYMGPQYDWHMARFSPQFFGHKSLTFELMDGTEHTYEEDAHVEYTHAKSK